MKLSQSNVILFCLLAAFLVFITLRGELPSYLSVLFSTQGQAGSGTGSSGSSGAPDTTATAAQTASDPIGAAAGALRRGLGIQNGLLNNLLPSIFGTTIQ